MPPARTRWLIAAALLSASPLCLPAAEDAAPHEAVLRAAGLKSDGPALLEFFRNRTPSDDERTRLTAAVSQLGADTYPARVQASKDLIAAGRRALPLLRPALADPYPEAARRARWAIQAIGEQPETPLALAAAALLARRKPAGAAAVVLDYLPFAEETGVEQELFEALLAVGFPAGKPDPALLAAVKAKAPQRRAAAGWALGRSRRAEQRALALPLLSDADAGVRWRTAEGLVAARDKQALPTLIALLSEGPADLAGQAEALLAQVAGDRAPEVHLGGEDAERRKCREAWADWWRAHGSRLDLAKLDLGRRPRGLRLVVALNGYGGAGRVWEYGGDRKPAWEMRDVGGPFDARVLPGGKVLVGEYDGRRVTERDRAGKVLWEYKVPNGVIEVQRLGNGNTLVATNYEIREVTRSGKVVFSHAERGGNIFSAQRLANGNTLYGLYTGSLIELGRGGKKVREVGIDPPTCGLVSVEVLPGGRYLMPQTAANRVVELDGSGKVTWQVAVNAPTSVAVLPGGNLLVGSHRLNSVREIDRQGKVLSEQSAEGQVFRVRVR